MSTTNSDINTTNPIGIVSGGTSTASFAHTNGTIFYSGTALAATATGTSGYALTSNGGVSAPTYQALSSSSGAWNLIQTQTASNSASLLFSSGISSTYYNYAIILNNVLPASASQQLQMQFSTNGGSSYESTYYYNYFYYPQNAGNSGPFGTGNTSAGSIPLSLPNATYNGDSTVTPQIAISGTVFLFSLTNNASNVFPGCVGDVCHSVTSGNPIYWVTVTGQCPTASISINAINFFFGSGNIYSGSISLYGISQ